MTSMDKKTWYIIDIKFRPSKTTRWSSNIYLKNNPTWRFTGNGEGNLHSFIQMYSHYAPLQYSMKLK